MNRRDALRRHARAIGAALTFAQALAFSGCSNMSGLDGSSSYSCKAPDGITCDSVSGTYANAIHNNVPSQRPRAAASPAPTGAASAPPMPRMPAAAAALPAPMPPRSPARILRLWFKPWEDADHDLYDQGYVYVQIDGGRWLIEHVQQQIREAYAPLRPPPRASAGANDAPSGSTAPKVGLPRPPDLDKLFPGAAAPTNRPDSTD
jgi:conjugal transfer pilus assembly protein TraV